MNRKEHWSRSASLKVGGNESTNTLEAVDYVFCVEKIDSKGFELESTYPVSLLSCAQLFAETAMARNADTAWDTRASPEPGGLDIERVYELFH